MSSTVNLIIFTAGDWYQINVTAVNGYHNIYFDGIEYLFGEGVANKQNWVLVDSISANFLPSVIAVYASSGADYGILASDSAGYVTDASWKCTGNNYADWMLTSFDDSAWPIPVMVKINEDHSVGPYVFYVIVN